jgi:hypothetical protein
MRSYINWIALAVLALGLMLPGNARAQAPSQYFPETGHTVSGRFLEYWRDNGGLAVFGYPLSEQIVEGGFTVQYFERQRFELHPENARPYDVLLGLLGAERISGGGAPPPPATPLPGCVFFGETQHNLCNQQGSLGFLGYWQSHGLEFDGRPGSSYQESLALFGFPISEAYDYTNSAGETVLAQWFERARFEWHPGNPDEYKVLLGLLGVEKLQAPPGPPLVAQVQIMLIALGEGERSGPTIGCGDAVVPVTVQVEPTTAPLRAALERLFSIKSEFYGESGLYNALHQSELRIDSLGISGGLARLSLSGTLRTGGVCDAPRVQAQIEQTMRQFPSVTSTEILLNGQPLADALSER